jgi:L-lactate dehydrogenase complex protein LldG
VSFSFKLFAFSYKMRDITTSKEKLLKKVRKALLEKRDNPYPNLEDLPMYPPNDEMLEVLFAEEFTAVSGQFVFCEDEVQFIENLLELAEERKWHKIYCWEPPCRICLNNTNTPFLKPIKILNRPKLALPFAKL